MRERMLGSDVLMTKIRRREIILAVSGDDILGWLRFSMFYDHVPIITMLYVEKNDRRQGIARKLVARFEKRMMAWGAFMVMASSPAGDDARHVFRKLGYEDAGTIELNPGHRERLFRKGLVSDSD
jgi:ribosomal protein S18 acetylase RimI-like enzyme